MSPAVCIPSEKRDEELAQGEELQATGSRFWPTCISTMIKTFVGGTGYLLSIRILHSK
jgi:hypothetical protein